MPGRRLHVAYPAERGRRRGGRVAPEEKSQCRRRKFGLRPARFTPGQRVRCRPEIGRIPPLYPTSPLVLGRRAVRVAQAKAIAADAASVNRLTKMDPTSPCRRSSRRGVRREGARGGGHLLCEETERRGVRTVVEKEDETADAHADALADAHHDVVRRATVATRREAPARAGKPALGERACGVDVGAARDERQDRLLGDAYVRGIPADARALGAQD